MVNSETFEGILDRICKEEADIKKYEHERQLETDGDMRIVDNRLIAATHGLLAVLYTMLYQHPGNKTIPESISVFPSSISFINLVIRRSILLRRPLGFNGDTREEHQRTYGETERNRTGAKNSDQGRDPFPRCPDKRHENDTACDCQKEMCR
jgi:hypothetical protein